MSILSKNLFKINQLKILNNQQLKKSTIDLYRTGCKNWNFSTFGA
jgi:hypothetical protein